MNIHEWQTLAKSYPPERVEIPVEFPFAIRRAKWEVAGQRLVQRSLGVARYPVDSRRVLVEFLGLSRGELSPLLEFLSRYGRWDEGNTFSIDSFWEVQDNLKELLSWPPRLQRPALRLRWVSRTFACSLGWGQQGGHAIPILVIRVESIMDAIIASIQIDVGVRGERWRGCKRPDCSEWFRITSAHKKEYHNQYCAHLESVRRNRRKQRDQERAKY